MDILGNIQNYIPNGKEFYALRDPAGAFQSKTPMSGTDMSNGSFNEEAVKEADRYEQNKQTLTEAARKAALQQDPTLRFVTRELAKGLLGSKLNYMAAQGKGDAAGMRQAEDAARSIREQGKEIGWDGAGFGADVTYEQAAQNLMNNDARAINDLFYGGMSANDYYNKQYEDMRKFGLGRKTAEEEATRMTDSYLQQRTNQMMDAFQAYGMDERGAINQNGLRILGMLGQLGSGDIANLYAKMNPSPAQNWNFGNTLITAANAEQSALRRMAQANDYQTQARREGFQHENYLTTLRAQLDMEKARYAKTVELQAKAMDREAGYQFMLEKLTPLYGEEAAAEIAANSLIGGKGKKSGGSSGNSSDDSGLKGKQLDMANALFNLEVDMKNILSTGKSYEDGSDTNAILRYSDFIEDMKEKGAPRDVIENAMQQHNAAVDQWELNHGGRGVSPWPHKRYEDAG